MPFAEILAAVGLALAGDAAVLLGEELHGKMQPVQIAAGRILEEVERLLGAAGEQQRVMGALQVLRRDVLADVNAAVEDDALGFHLAHAVGDDRLLHLEVGDAVGEQAARLRALLVDVHLVTGAGELLGGGEAGGTRADNCNLLAGPLLGRLWHDPAFLQRAVGDRALDGLDGHRVVVDVERARRLARRRADAPRDLGEVVGRVQVLRRRLPVAAPDEIVPVRDLVVHRTARVAVGDAAVHAAAGLGLRLLLGERDDELLPMLHALGDRTVAPVLPIELHEAGDLAHRRLLQCVQSVGSLDESGAWIYIFAAYIQEIVMQVAKWGNSLAVRLPAAVVEALELKAGDDITLHVRGARLIEVEKTPSQDELFERVRRLKHKLPADFKFDRLEAHERD